MSKFGRWIEALCKLYNISETTLANRAGLHQTTVTTAKYEPKTPDEETVKKIWKALVEIGEETGLAFPTMQEGFFNHAHATTELQDQRADWQLHSLEQLVERAEEFTAQMRELERVRADFEQQRARMEQQQQRATSRIRELQSKVRQQDRELQQLRQEATKKERS